MPDPAPLGSDADERPGRWVVETTWPPENAERHGLHMSECRLIGRHLHLHEPTTGSLSATGDAAVLRSPPAIGSAAGNVLQFGDIAGRPGDQAADDGRSHTFTSCPLTERVEILGPASIELLVDAPEALEPGKPYRVTVPLFATGYAFGAGNRMRLSVSASFWPWLWPSPTPTAVTLHPEGGTLRLPVGRTQRIEMTFSDGTTTDPTDGLTRTETELNRFQLTEGDPASAVVECERSDAIGRGGWQAEVRFPRGLIFPVADHRTGYEVARGHRMSVP